MRISEGNSCSDHDYSNNSSSVFIELSQRIEQLSFPSFQMLALLWLSAKGFEHIRNLGRCHRRGRRPTGGADFLAVLPRSGMPIAIQVRHWQTPVQRRAVDELRGFMLRHGISAGLIVSNQGFYKQAELSALGFPGRPIQLVSGQDISSSLISLGLGFKTFEDSSLAVDEGLFRTLKLLGFASAMEAISGTARAGCKAETMIQENCSVVESYLLQGQRHFRTPLTIVFVMLLVAIVLWLVVWSLR